MYWGMLSLFQLWPTVVECPPKPNLLSVGLLICRVFWFFWGENMTGLGFSENMFLCFLCPLYVKSVCSSVVFFSSVLAGIKELMWELFDKFFYLAGKHYWFENVDMSTYQQIWLFSACGRPGAKFYVGLLLGGEFMRFFMGKIEGIVPTLDGWHSVS